MPSTNGHGLKRVVLWAILYARVSTDEQARSGYSLAQQLEALRAYAAQQGYEILEEVRDPGQSGASLERPGMDRVRDLVSAGGVYVVLAQDRDRFSREPAYTYLLRREFEEHGCELRSLNDRGDGSPEGDLTDGILDQLAKYERAKIAERSRRGKLRKAREGRAVAPIAKYGYRFNGARDALLVHEPEMEVVEKIFRMAAEGSGVCKIQTALYRQGIPSPRGRPVWDRRVLRKIVASDDYRPLSFEEISELVAPEVAARLYESKSYGVQWFNRDKAVTRTVSEPDGNGGRRYRKRKTLVRRPREEWLAIPVPTSDRLPRDLVDLARATMDANQGSERKRLARVWELRGVMRCSCGSKIQTKTMMPEGRGPYHYYLCARRVELRGMCSCTQKAVRAVDAEEAIWEFISRLLKDPERIRLGMERLIVEERAAANRGDPESTAKAWADKADECARLRAAYQDQQASGLMTLEELGSKLSELDEMRRHAERELSALLDHQERVKQLEEDRDALIKEMAETAPDGLDSLAGEERNKVYRMLRLEVTPTPEGYSITGALRVRMQNRTDALAYPLVYTSALTRSSAEVFVDKFQRALKHPVHYVDGGWQILVDGLREAAERFGTRIVRDARVQAVELGAGRARGVRLRDGSLVRASAVVLAMGPRDAAKLVDRDVHAVLGRLVDDLIPARVACLDVALSRLPSPGVPVVQDLDGPRFMTAQSLYSRVAPEGAALVYTFKQLDPRRHGDTHEDERDLEDLLDRAQPGWRDLLIRRQYLPRIEAVGALPTAAGGGFAGRPGHRVPGIDHLYVAGDWVGPEGFLADASLASARRAAWLALEDGAVERGEISAGAAH